MLRRCDMSASQRNVDLPASSQLVESLLANQAKEIEINKQAEDNKKQNLKYMIPLVVNLYHQLMLILNATV